MTKITDNKYNLKILVDGYFYAMFKIENAIDEYGNFNNTKRCHYKSKIARELKIDSKRVIAEYVPASLCINDRKLDILEQKAGKIAEINKKYF